MKKQMKKLLAAGLALCLILSAVPVAASFLCSSNATKFAEYLSDGETVIQAFFKAGHYGEAVGKIYGGTNDHHIQKVLFIPQARYETVYSPSVYYEYDASDVRIAVKCIQDSY